VWAGSWLSRPPAHYFDPWTFETWTFDVCTNTFARMHPDREPGPYPDRVVYDVDSDRTIAIGPMGVTWAYDLGADTWTEKGVRSFLPNSTAAVYDPASGLVIVTDEAEMWSYDVEADSWTRIPEGPPQPGALLAYDASVDRLVAYGFRPSPETWLFDFRTRGWTKSGAEAPVVVAWMTGPSIAYDDARERTVVSGNARIAAFDATADRWEILAEASGDLTPVVSAPMVYDSVNGRLVGWRGDDLVAFDTATREWTVLLKASDGRPPGS
jgi:hypothetical protein